MLRVAKECRERRVEDGPLGKVHNYRKIRGGESEETRRGVFWKDEENSEREYCLRSLEIVEIQGAGRSIKSWTEE